MSRADPDDGRYLALGQIRAEIRPLAPHSAPTGLIEVENTHNMAGGTVYELDTLREIYEGARGMGLPVHMDGARVFHAATYLGVPCPKLRSTLTRSCSVCRRAWDRRLGLFWLGRKLIDKGRLYRKRLGGGMRQAGILAAAGLISLEEMPKRLQQDHENAQRLATGLASIAEYASGRLRRIS